MVRDPETFFSSFVLRLRSKSCGLRYSTSAPLTWLAAWVETHGQSANAAIGPHRESAASIGRRRGVTDVEADDMDGRLEDEFDSYWDLDVHQARKDKQDLRAFSRVHIMPSMAGGAPNPNRTYVFFDIEINNIRAGRIAMEAR